MYDFDVSLDRFLILENFAADLTFELFSTFMHALDMKSESDLAEEDFVADRTA